MAGRSGPYSAERRVVNAQFVGVLRMSKTGWSQSGVPYGADQTTYLVVDRFSGGSVYRETEIERSDLETVISDLLTGQFNDPVRVVAFNTLGRRRFRRCRSRTSNPVRHCGWACARASSGFCGCICRTDAPTGVATSLGRTNYEYEGARVHRLLDLRTVFTPQNDCGRWERRRTLPSVTAVVLRPPRPKASRRPILEAEVGDVAEYIWGKAANKAASDRHRSDRACGARRKRPTGLWWSVAAREVPFPCHGSFPP
jgi:hypothetical protein